MDKNNSYEIPFGAKDSELKGWEYTIPEGMEAEIKDSKIIVREKESEDEKIRKIMLQELKGSADSIILTPQKRKRWIAWLEKQGEQKLFNNDEYQTVSVKTLDRLYESEKELERLKQGSQNLANSAKTCKVNPKFKAGDWIVLDNDGFTISIKDVVDEIYYFHQGSYVYVEDVDKCYHLWTIEDAKDGDVLVASDHSIFILKDVVNNDCICYIALSTDNTITLEDYWEVATAVLPATKEQRDHLFQKMKEAGYEWDAEKKELKKIEQNPAWSEEDEKMLNKCIEYASNIIPVKPTKERGLFVDFKRIPDKKAQDWLKFLKEKHTWKPSDEQLEALEHSLGDYNIAIFEDRHKILTSLYQDLKKLTE